MRWCVLAAALAVLLAAWLLDVRSTRRVGIAGTDFVLPELCTFHRATGLDCPGCGMTRSMVSMAHGEIEVAARYHPLGVPLFVWLVLLVPWELWHLARHYCGLPLWPRWQPGRRVTLATVLAATTVYLVFGAGRVVWQCVGR